MNAKHALNMADKKEQQVPDYANVFPSQTLDSASNFSDQHLQKSLQTCKVNENEEKLLGLLEFYTKRKANLKVIVIESLLFVLRQLLAASSIFDSRGKGFLLFDDAYGLFISFFDKHVTKQEFRNYLLSQEYGLRICIATIHSVRYKYYRISYYIND